jgi:hypothetical protein
MDIAYTYLGLYLIVGFMIALVEIRRSFRKKTSVSEKDLADILKIRFKKEIASGEIQLTTHGDRVTLNSSDLTRRAEIDSTVRVIKFGLRFRRIAIILAFLVVDILAWPFFVHRVLFKNKKKL